MQSCKGGGPRDKGRHPTLPERCLGSEAAGSRLGGAKEPDSQEVGPSCEAMPSGVGRPSAWATPLTELPLGPPQSWACGERGEHLLHLLTGSELHLVQGLLSRAAFPVDRAPHAVIRRPTCPLTKIPRAAHSLSRKC